MKSRCKEYYAIFDRKVSDKLELIHFRGSACWFWYLKIERRTSIWRIVVVVWKNGREPHTIEIEG